MDLAIGSVVLGPFPGPWPTAWPAQASHTTCGQKSSCNHVGRHGRPAKGLALQPPDAVGGLGPGRWDLGFPGWRLRSLGRHGHRGAAAGEGGFGGASGVAGHAGASSGDGPACLEGEPCAGYTVMGVPENVAGYNLPTMLVDMDGVLVHTWTIPGFPARVLPGGSLIGCVGVFPGSHDCIEMQQVSWAGELQWSFSAWADIGNGDTAARQHHDYQRQGNPVGYYAPGQEFVEGGNDSRQERGQSHYSQP